MGLLVLTNMHQQYVWDGGIWKLSILSLRIFCKSTIISKKNFCKQATQKPFRICIRKLLWLFSLLWTISQKRKKILPSGTLATPSPLVTWCLNYYEPQKIYWACWGQQHFWKNHPRWMNECLFGCSYNLELLFSLSVYKEQPPPKTGSTFYW